MSHRPERVTAGGPPGTSGLTLNSSAPRRALQGWDRHWFGPVAAIRPYLVRKVVLCLLALDVWLLRIPRGGRYGAGGFDVAHFQWLDGLQPLPTPDVFIGLMLSVGVLALVCAFTEPGPWAHALLAVMYTYGWAMSLHDSFQHHYFVSLVLVLFVCFPRVTAVELSPPPVAPSGRRRRKGALSDTSPPTATAWAYKLLGVTTGILYAFTAFTKLDPEWRAGLVIMRLARPLAPVEAWVGGFGVPPSVFWGSLAMGVFAAEAVVAAGYLLTGRLDDDHRPWLRGVAWLALAAAVGFHVSAETVLRLRIGWFSYYMIGLACVYFLPSSLLWAVGGLVTRPAARSAAVWSTTSRALGSGSRALDIGVTAVGAAAGAAVVVAVGFALDLPGAATVGVVLASGLAGATVLALVLGRQQHAMKYALATAVAAVVMWAAIAQSRVRLDYYVRVGFDLQRRGHRAAAFDAYERATRYGPEGLSPEILADAFGRQSGRAEDP